MDRSDLLQHLHDSHGFQYSPHHDGYTGPEGVFIPYDEWMATASHEALAHTHRHDHLKYEGGGGLLDHHH